MATLEELVIKIEAQNASLLKSLEQSQKTTQSAMDSMNKAVENFSKDGTKNVGKFDNIMNVFAGATLAGVVLKAAELAGRAITAFIGNFTGGITEAQEFEQAMVRLSNSLALSGNFSADAKRDLEGYVGAMEQLSGVDDAIIAGNLAMLSSLTRLDSEGLKRAQSAALDLSAAIGIDLNTATQLIGKAAAGNVTAFSRYGIQLEKTGDNARDFEKALSTLEQRFGGASAGAMQTFAGALTGLRNNFGNFFQALGDVVVKNNVVIAVVKELSQTLFNLTDSATKSGDMLRNNLGEGLVMILKSLVFATEAADTFVRVMEAGLRTILLPINAVADSIRVLGDLLDGSLDEPVFENTKNQWEDLNNAVSGESALSNLSDMFADLLGTAQGAMYGIKGATVETTASIANQTDAVKQLTMAEQARVDQAAAFGKQLFDQAVSITDGYQMQQDALQMAYENDLINFESYKEAKLASQEAFFAQQLAMLAQSNLSENELDIAKTQLAQQQGLARLKTKQDLDKKEEELLKQKLQAYSGFFGNLATLQQTGSKEMFAIGKAAAVAQATIDGFTAINAAYKQGTIIGGPPLGVAFAAAAGAATAVQISKIAATNLRTGIDNVPGVGTADNFPAMLAPGERVVPTKTNEDLTSFLQNQTSNQTPTAVFNLHFNGPVWSNKAEAGAEIVDAINEAFDRGMGLRLRNA